MPNPPEISKEAEQDYDVLLERMTPLVEKWMQERDDFIPCGASIRTDGEVVGHLVDAGEATKTESAMHILFTGLQARARSGEIRATCVCYNGGFEEDGEYVPAIVIILEHLQGPAMLLHRPYRKNPDGAYGYAQTEVQWVQPEIFAR
jgi:hypothetical protein